jgi:transcriptional regulator NrdR family protein
MYCPNCGVFTQCTTWHAGSHGKNVSAEPYHPDVRWYLRRRVCSRCSTLFSTAEIGSEFVSELLKLREEVRRLRRESLKYEAMFNELKESVLSYLSERNHTPKSIARLAESIYCLPHIDPDVVEDEG